MKALKLIIIGMALIVVGTLQAQVSVTVNGGSPPPWGPVGYSTANYYYLPDVNAFYHVPSAMFIYNNDGAWVRRSYLPARYSNYDLYSGYKVVKTDYKGSNPKNYFKEFKTKYVKGYRGPTQKTIGVRPGNGNAHANIPGKGNSFKKMVPGNNKSAGNNNNNRHDMGGKNNNNGGKGNGKGNDGGKGKNK